MLYRCRSCGFMTDTRQADGCPSCGRMFYDVFTSSGIVTYGIMEEIESADAPMKDYSDYAEDAAEVMHSVALENPAAYDPMRGVDPDGDCSKCAWTAMCGDPVSGCGPRTKPSSGASDYLRTVHYKS